ncbi:hypothetical protein ACFT9M_18710 [Micromonospora purpureochromogenes]|uniref:hypothetical protein n=1 Tax=Micromonospora purpureochromogenes TaxID=47872 RepID=UPI00363C3460
MYMVIGEQRMPGGGPEERRAQFAHMAEVVRQSAGFVRGWWGPDQADAETGHALVLFDTLDRATEFAATVERYVSGVRLRVMAVDVTVRAS